VKQIVISANQHSPVVNSGVQANLAGSPGASERVAIVDVKCRQPYARAVSVATISPFHSPANPAGFLRACGSPASVSLASPSQSGSGQKKEACAQKMLSDVTLLDAMDTVGLDIDLCSDPKEFFHILNTISGSNVFGGKQQNEAISIGMIPNNRGGVRMQNSIGNRLRGNEKQSLGSWPSWYRMAEKHTLGSTIAGIFERIIVGRYYQSMKKPYKPSTNDNIENLDTVEKVASYKSFTEEQDLIQLWDKLTSSEKMQVRKYTRVLFKLFRSAESFWKQF
jgi:hypothetical protein